MEKDFYRIISQFFTDSERLDFDFELEKKCAEWRGYYIQGMVHIEELMELVISQHFVKDHLIENFTASILCKEKFTLHFKLEVIAFIIRNEVPNFITDKAGKTYLEDMENAITLRNDFAHRKFFSIDAIDTREIVLHTTSTNKGKIKTKRVELTQTIMFEYMKKLLNLYILTSMLGANLKEKREKK